MEVGLDVLEQGDRAVGTSTAAYPRVSEWPTSSEGRHLPEHTAGSVGLGDTNGVVEGQPKGLVHLRTMGLENPSSTTKKDPNLFTALPAIEQGFLNVLQDGEPCTASRIGRCIFAIRASNTPGQGSYEGALY